MAESRKMVTRTRGERRSGITQTSTPPAPQKSLKRKSPTPPPVEVLRSKDPPSLPTSKEKQSSDVSDLEYQTIAER
jgi:hypothetical protein